MAGVGRLAECVINISEGRDGDTIEAVRDAGGATVLDVHSDPEHHRSVLTLGGTLEAVEDATRRVVSSAVTHIDLRSHVGVHPRLGAADVVPFVPLPDARAPSTGSDRPELAVRPDVLTARNRFAAWAGAELELPCFLYGPERSLPDVRRNAFISLEPDTGPSTPHPTAGSTAVGARHVLVAYNVWITSLRDPGTDVGRPTRCRWHVRWLRRCGARPSGAWACRSARVHRSVSTSPIRVPSPSAASTTRCPPAQNRPAVRYSGLSSSVWCLPQPSSRSPVTAGQNSTWTRTGPSRD